MPRSRPRSFLRGLLHLLFAFGANSLYRGIVSLRTRGVNQRGEVVIEFKRTFMAYSRDADEVAETFPHVDEPWRD